VDFKIFFILGSEWVDEILLLLGKNAGCEKNLKKFGFLPEKRVDHIGARPLVLNCKRKMNKI